MTKLPSYVRSLQDFLANTSYTKYELRSIAEAFKLYNLYFMGGFPSGQRGQTVNLLQIASVVRIHHHPFISRDGAVWKLAGLITRRSEVQILLPQLDLYQVVGIFFYAFQHNIFPMTKINYDRKEKRMRL